MLVDALRLSTLQAVALPILMPGFVLVKA